MGRGLQVGFWFSWLLLFFCVAAAIIAKVSDWHSNNERQQARCSLRHFRASGNGERFWPSPDQEMVFYFFLKGLGGVMKFKKMGGLLVAIMGLVTLSGNALAQSSCDSVLSSYEYYASINDQYWMTYIKSNHPECFGSNASSAAATQTIAATNLQHVLTISNAVSARFSMTAPPAAQADAGQRLGMAAGNTVGKWNAWASVGQDYSEYDRGNYSSNGAIRNHNADLDVTNVVVGADFALSPLWTVGLSAAFDHSSGASKSYTNGVLASSGTHSSDGYSIAPYVAWQINKDLSLDATLGFGKNETSSSGNVDGEADRLFYGANLNYVKWYGNWQVSGKGSYFYGEEKYGDLRSSTLGVLKGTATKNKLDQIRLGGQMGYWMNNGVMPYFGLTYLNDLTHSTSAAPAVQMATEIGKTAWLCALGVNFFSLSNGVTGGVAYNLETGRDHARREALIANINVRF